MSRRHHHLKVRLEQEKLCLLVMIGVRADGRKELVALTDGSGSTRLSFHAAACICRAPSTREFPLRFQALLDGSGLIPLLTWVHRP